MRTNRLLPALVGAVLYTLFDCHTAGAWGPGTHVALAEEVLRHAAWLTGTVGGIITRYALDYVYGNLAADVVFAKRLSRVKQFCHHWSTGFAVLDQARCDRERAFAYGYLSHLAADTVAHGKYVPHQIAVSHSTLNLGHLYWELRADQTLESAVWGRVDEVMADRYRQHHQLLSDLLKQTFLPYDANRQLFEGLNRLVGWSSWRRTMAVWERCSRHPLPADLLRAYRGECLDRIMCLLSSQRRSPLLLEDPNGTAALGYLRDHRRDLRRRMRRGLPLGQRVMETAASYAPSPWRSTAMPAPEWPQAAPSTKSTPPESVSLPTAAAV